MKSLQAGLEALGHPAGEPEVVLGQLVKVQRGGELVRMSQRARATSSRSPTSSTRSIPTSAGSRSCSRASTPRRRSTSTSSPRSRWRTPSTTCSTRTRASRRSAGRPRPRASRASRSSTTNLAPLVHERELDLLRSLAVLPRSRRRGGGAAAPHRVTTWVRELRGTVPRLLPRLPRHLRRRRAHAGAAVARGGVPASGWRTRSPSSVSTRPTRCTGSTTTRPTESRG